MNATDQLRDEHKALLLMLAILEKITAKLQSEGFLEKEHLAGMLEFFSVFVDKCHHGKEEDLLFPALEKAGVPKEGGPIGIMLQEHDLGRSYIRGLRQGTADFKTVGGKQAVAQIVANIKKYSDLLTGHIDKEDNILYPIAL